MSRHPWARPQPLVFGVYRSALDRFDASAVAVGSEAIEAPGAAALGPHQLTIPLAGGLPPDPEQPYVLVVANPAAALGSGAADATASFRTHVIAVVTHGGLQDRSEKHGPAWEQAMAASLRREGFDVVIPFNWVAESSDPGAAAPGGTAGAEGAGGGESIPGGRARRPLLHRPQRGDGGQRPGDPPARDTDAPAPQLKAGYLAVTMLDPHAANPDVPGQQYSVASGPLGWLAKVVIDDYQARAHDPRVTVPPGADRVEVFYEHTPASRARTGPTATSTTSGARCRCAVGRRTTST